MLNLVNHRMPQVSTETTITPRTLDLIEPRVVPGGVIIHGASLRDPASPVVHEIRAGKLLGKNSTTKKYEPAIVGLTSAARAANVTNFTVDAATAVEIARLKAHADYGNGGNLSMLLIGPPTAGGVVAVNAVTVTAVNTGTGVCTINEANIPATVTKSIVALATGSAYPKGVFLAEDGYPTRVIDENGNDRDLSMGKMLIGAEWINTTQVTDWPADAALIAWLKAQLRLVGPFWCFSDDFTS